MTATAQELSRAADPLRLAVRLAGLWPRLAAAVTLAAIRQTRAVSGLDYSLIDYPGILSAAYRFGLEWWLEPHRALAAQTEFWWRNLTLIAEHFDAGAQTKPTAGGDKRFQDKAWSEDPTLRLVRDFYVLNADWMLSQVRAARNLDRHDKHKLEFYTRELLSAELIQYAPS
jgi:hypothetical protein